MGVITRYIYIYRISWAFHGDFMTSESVAYFTPVSVRNWDDPPYVTCQLHGWIPMWQFKIHVDWTKKTDFSGGYTCLTCFISSNPACFLTFLDLYKWNSTTLHLQSPSKCSLLFIAQDETPTLNEWAVLKTLCRPWKNWLVKNKCPSSWIKIMMLPPTIIYHFYPLVFDS